MKKAFWFAVETADFHERKIQAAWDDYMENYSIWQHEETGRFVTNTQQGGGV